MAHLVEAADMWRNFVPVAPDIEIEVLKNKAHQIDLNEYLIQGARDLVTGEPDMDVIQSLKTQRGWRCNHFIHLQPQYGYAGISNEVHGIRYAPMENFIGRDCFSYILNNGYQSSSPGKISILVRDYYTARIVVESSNVTENTGEYRFIGNFYIPEELNTWDDVGFKWYQVVPYRSDVSGTPTIYYKKELISGTEWSLADSYNTNSVFKKVRAYETPWISYTWPDTHLYGIDSATNQPYRQPKGPYPVMLEMHLVKSPRFTMISSWYGGSYRFTHWAESEVLELDVRSKGRDWWKDGYVNNVDAPGYVPTAGGPYVPPLIYNDADGEALELPVIVASEPSPGSSDVSLSTKITLVFDRDVFPSSGAFVLHKDDDTVVDFIGVTNPNQVEFSGNTVNITLTSGLLYSTTYYLVIGTSAIVDIDGNTYEGIQDNSYVFSTQVDPDTVTD